MKISFSHQSKNSKQKTHTSVLLIILKIDIFQNQNYTCLHPYSEQKRLKVF